MPKKSPKTDIITLRSDADIARHINAKYGVSCDRNTVLHWRRNFEPPLPKSDGHNTTPSKAVNEWVEKYLLPKLKSGLTDEEVFKKSAVAKAERQIIARDREKIGKERDEGTAIERAEARRINAGALRKLMAFVRREVEASLPMARRQKLIELGADEKILSAFNEWDTREMERLIDRVVKRCRAAESEADAETLQI